MYTSGIVSMIVCLSASSLICISLRFWLIRENRRRDNAAEARYALGALRPTEEDVLREGQKDLTCVSFTLTNTTDIYSVITRIPTSDTSCSHVIYLDKRKLVYTQNKN